MIEPYTSPEPRTNDERLFAAWFYEQQGYLYREMVREDEAIAAFEKTL